jgi:hypothetical protein
MYTDVGVESSVSVITGYMLDGRISVSSKDKIFLFPKRPERLLSSGYQGFLLLR